MADAETILRQCKLETPPVAIFKENDSRYKCLGLPNRDQTYPEVCKGCDFFEGRKAKDK